MPSSSDQTRVGRTLTLGGGAGLPWRAETSNSRFRRKTSVLRPMISARTARIDDNLGRGTHGSNPLPSSGESGANLAFGGPLDGATGYGNRDAAVDCCPRPGPGVPRFTP